jgi:hypothetical protein
LVKAVPPDGVRDRFGARARKVAVEREGVLQPSTFDGNHSNAIISWIVPRQGHGWNGLTEDQLDTLMAWSVAGHLAWVVVPTDNL